MPDQDDLSAAQAFRAARDAATPNWCNHYHRKQVFRNLRKWPEVSRGDLIAKFESFADADFAIAARNSDLPERVERLAVENERLNKRLFDALREFDSERRRREESEAQERQLTRNITAAEHYRLRTSHQDHWFHICEGKPFHKAECRCVECDAWRETHGHGK